MTSLHLLTVFKTAQNYSEYDHKHVGLFQSAEEAEFAYTNYCSHEFPDGHRVEEVNILHIPS